MMKKAMFPGTFDPLHEGHRKVIQKALLLFDELFVVVTTNLEKPKARPISERFEAVQALLKGEPRIKVYQNASIMTADFAKQHGITFIIRSARNNVDFQYELELAAGNHALNPALETVLIIPDYEDIAYQSRLIRQGGKPSC